MGNFSPTQWFKKEQSDPVQDRSTGLTTSQTDPLARMQQEFGRMFENFFKNGGFPLPFEQTGSRSNGDGLMAMLRPSLDITETDKTYTINIEVPGVSENDIELMVEDDTLVVRGEKNRESVEDGEQFHRVERSFGRFQRMLTLPGDTDIDNISADFDNGVLSIRLPRKEGQESSRGRRIQIGQDQGKSKRQGKGQGKSQSKH